MPEFFESEPFVPAASDALFVSRQVKRRSELLLVVADAPLAIGDATNVHKGLSQFALLPQNRKQRKLGQFNAKQAATYQLVPSDQVVSYYPISPGDFAINIPAETLRYALQHVLRATAKTEDVFSAVCLTIREDRTLAVAGSDRYWLSVYVTDKMTPLATGRSECLIHRDAAFCLLQILEYSDAKVTIQSSGQNIVQINLPWFSGQVLAHYNPTKYPDYDTLLPTTYRTRCVVDTVELYRAVLAVARTSGLTTVRVINDGTSVRISPDRDPVQTSDIVDVPMTEAQGAVVKNTFSARYLLDALAAYAGDTSLEWCFDDKTELDKLTPVRLLLRPAGRSDAVHILTAD